MSMTIEHMRVSWIRALSLPSLVGAARVPGPSVGTLNSYSDALEAAARPEAPWRRPWDGDTYFNKLWKRNLRTVNYASVDAVTASKRMVPLWSKTPIAIRWRGGGETHVSAHRYLLPGAMAVVITADFVNSFGFASALASIAAAKRDEMYLLDGVHAMRLPQLHDQLLADCQREVLGSLDHEADGDMDPLAIVSVLAATGVASDAMVEQDNAVHRLLRGFCAFDRNGLDHSVGEPVAQSTLIQSDRSLDATLLVFHRSRALWSPSKMFDPRARLKLDCYHNNLTVSSAITESLLAFVSNGHARSKSQAGVDISKRAVKILGMLYGPAKDMWSSTSIRRQIDDSGAVPIINELRWRYGWEPLAARTPIP